MTDEASPSGTHSFRWFLESLVEGGRQLRRVAVHPLPFRVGRKPGLELSLPSDAVSKEHAELYQDGESLRVRDFKSKNGTFVNRDRVGDAAVHEGDIIHFAQLEFRLGRQELEEPDEMEPNTVSITEMALPHGFIEGTREMPELLREAMVAIVFQPIVSLPGGVITGYEVLGRGRHPRLPEEPTELFHIASGVGAEAELSRLFRRKALELVAGRRDLPMLFLNTHPAELGEPGLLESLAEAKRLAPHLRLALEIHEGALADPTSIDGLRTQLAKLGIDLAYDDFGAGQARLLELAEVPPHFLKFDMRFIHGIDSAPPSRRRLLSSLVSVARDLLVYTVAEGVETKAEADVCSEIGFTHAQGYHFGMPRPVEEL
jgi:EAL domain-containing protein (putative c-di-GMP-specific phosphodiesterase class I)